MSGNVRTQRGCAFQVEEQQYPGSWWFPALVCALQTGPDTAGSPTSASMASSSRFAVSAHFGVLSLLSAFLLFQVQPVISNFILPWFGGGPGIWTTCMVFFQVVLFAGYAYAHA